MTETEIIDLCKRADPTGQRMLYNKYVNRMTRLCVRYVNDEEAAKDVMADAFMRVFEHMNQFQYRGEGSLNAWIKRIFINQSLMWLRKKKSLVLYIESHEIPETVQQISEINMEAEDLYTIIRQLPHGYRTIFNLYAIEGYTHQEISVQLNITESTSRSQLTRARQLLSTILSHPKT